MEAWRVHLLFVYWSNQTIVTMPLVLLGLGVLILALAGAGHSTSMAAQCPQCSTAYYPANMHGPHRDLRSISLVVLHSTEGCHDGVCPTAASVSDYFATTTNDASTQLVVDDSSCYMSLRDDTVPYGASGGDANLRGVHIEFAGTANWSRQEWLSHSRMLTCGAYRVAQWCDRYGIPVQFLDPSHLAAGYKGITTHANVTAAFHVPYGHTDPGPNFPLDVFLGYVRQFSSQSGLAA